MSDVTRRQLGNSAFLIDPDAEIIVSDGAQILVLGALTLEDYRGQAGTIRAKAGAVIDVQPGASLSVGGTLSLKTDSVFGREMPESLAGNLSGLIAHHYALAPAAASATAVKSAVTLGEAAQDVATGITNPDYPRIVTVKGNAGGIVGDVEITGTNVLGEAITETIALNGSTEVLGTKAFATVTNINLPAKTNASGDTVSIGVGKKFGMPHAVYNAAFLLVKLFNGSADSGTLAVSADLEKNLFSLIGTPDGAKTVDLVYLK